MSESTQPTLRDRLSTGLLRILPQHLLAAAMYRIARSEIGWLKSQLINFVIRRYRVDMTEAAQRDPAAYPSFNAFFTRALAPTARPIAIGSLVAPADGVLSQIGAIRGESLLQAKGHDFELCALLAGDKHKTAAFQDGQFATVYLSPRDYHRVHIPYAGTLESMVFVPGDLFSVSAATAQLVPGLFARNERLICYFDTELGPMAVVLVGAIFVGSMQTAWHGEVRGARAQPTKWSYPERAARHFAAGDEIGRFNMGSTVIVLVPAGTSVWEDRLGPDSPVQVGQAIGHPRSAG
ncbi:MAG: archaetidylserine decarboxylase [Sedimenticolaceae bacterium]